MRALIVALSLLLLPGCSTIKLAYNNLDTLANWAADDAVDFSDLQEAQFDSEFAELWRWHRTTQLARYAADLRDLAGQSAQPVSVEQAQAFALRANRHSLQLFEAALPAAARLLATLDEQQIERLLSRLREQRSEQLKERAAMTVEDWREAARKDMHKALKDWVGPLDDAQTRRVAQWASQRQAEPQQWLEYQAAWEDVFHALLRTRTSPDFEQRLRAHFDESKDLRNEALDRAAERDRAQWFALMRDLSALLTPKQRARFQERLTDLADDLEELAAETGDG